MVTDILITGATGNIGLEVIRQFDDTPRLRAGVRNPDKARSILGDEIDIVAFDFEKPETYAGALAGIRHIFLVRPPAISDVQTHIAPFIAAAQTAGVEHVVFLSLMGVENNRIVPHYKIEKLLQACGMTWTFLRASFFMENLTTTHRDEIRDEDMIYVPAGSGKTSFIDGRDIAAIAVKTLSEDGHANQAYTLTGAEALDYDEVAAILSEVLGRKITYARPGILGFARYQRKRGIAWAYIIVMIGLYSTARFGMAKGITPELADLLGRPPRTVREFIEDHRDVWLRAQTN